MARLVTPDAVGDLACLLRERGWMLVTAESCTGGGIAAACTDMPGSSDWFDRGYVTYSNRAKIEMLGVDPALIEEHGAVSEAVARAMARGAQERSSVQVALAVTGVAGPAGGTPAKPVGTVWFAWAVGDRLVAECGRFEGDRSAVRAAAVRHALAALLPWVRP